MCLRVQGRFDIVSAGELARVLAVDADPSSIVYSGVETKDDIKQALEAGIGCFNVESMSELDTLDRVADEMGVQAPISIRINPDVDANTHPYISTGLKENKFGDQPCQNHRGISARPKPRELA